MIGTFPRLNRSRVINLPLVGERARLATGGYLSGTSTGSNRKDVVRRYVAAWRRCQPGIRGFASLEDDMAKCYDVRVDGIAVDNVPGHPVIIADAKDENFYAAIFGNDDDAIHDLSAADLEQARKYIICGEGVMPVRKWHMLRKSTRTPSSVITHP